MNSFYKDKKNDKLRLYVNRYLDDYIAKQRELLEKKNNDSISLRPGIFKRFFGFLGGILFSSSKKQSIAEQENLNLAPDINKFKKDENIIPISKSTHPWKYGISTARTLGLNSLAEDNPDLQKKKKIENVVELTKLLNSLNCKINSYEFKKIPNLLKCGDNNVNNFKGIIRDLRKQLDIFEKEYLTKAIYY